MKVVRWVVAVAVLAYVVYGGYYFLSQNSMVFPVWNVHSVPIDPATVPGLHDFELSDGNARVDAWYLTPLDSSGAPVTFTGDSTGAADGSAPPYPAPLLVIAHGNAALIDDWRGDLGPVRQAGAGILLVEYPGYGRSRGQPSQKRIVNLFAAGYDSVAAWGWADTTRAAFAGRSLGGGVACALAQRRPNDALILLSTFTSVRSFAADYYLPGFLVTNPFDNLAVLETYSKPVLLVHALDDTTVPYAHSRALHETAANSTLITREHGGHNTLEGHWDEFWTETGVPFLVEAGVLAAE
ncbi:MAG: hypothetical protein MAG453_00580 [Calditrichaeota bacterium]|nr:hypothetical protein [Calditrichota bacterium]